VPSGTNGNCDVSDHAWPQLAYGTGGAVGAVFGASSSDPFENWSCTGATIDRTTVEINGAIAAGTTDDNVTHNRFAGLGTDTARVQISAGGDDLGFGPLLTCAISVLRQDDNTHKMSNGHTCIPNPADPAFQAHVNALIPRLISLYELAGNIPGSANGASGPAVEAISYPMFFPAGNNPACGWEQTHITRADQIWINQDTLLVDNAIRQAAANAQVDFIDFATALQGATICDNPRGVNTIGDVLTHLTGAFHPNALGHQRMLASYLRQNFFGAAGFSATTPADGTLVGDRAGDAIYVAAGGTLFPFAKQAELSSSIYASTNIILEPSNQIAAQISVKPKDGTLLKDATTGAIFAVSGGALVPLAPSSIMLPAITVPTESLNGYPIASGDFFTVAGGDGTVYESVGGAPVPVTDWSHVGGPQPTGILSQGEFDNMRPVPPDGTFVSATVPGTSTTNNYEFAGGAPIFVSDFSHVGGPPAIAPVPIDQTAIDNAGSGGKFSHMSQLPADGTFVTATDPATGAVNPYVFAGGAPIFISDWSHLGGQPTGTIAAIDQTALDNAGTGGVDNHVRPTPADGTYVDGLGTGGGLVEAYVFAGGAPIPITDWTHLGGPAAGTPPAGVNPIGVDENALDNAGTGGPYNHVRQTPADNTILAGNGDKINNIFVMAGGAPIYVTNFEDIGGARASTSVDQTAINNAGTGGVFSHLRSQPADGTIVESFGTGKIYQIESGTPIQNCTAAPTFLYVDETTLQKAGTGAPYNNLNPRVPVCPTAGLDDTPANFKFFFNSSTGAGNATATSVSAPAADGHAMDINYQSGNPAFMTALAYTRTGANDAATTFQCHFDFLIPNTKPVQALTFTMSNYIQNKRYQWALQWQNIGGGQLWKLWTGSAWQSTAVSSNLHTNTWYSLTIDGTIVTGKVQYKDFILDGTTTTLTASFAPTAETGDGLVTGAALTGDSTADHYQVYVDDVHFTWK
jgi:hypothetical protein